MGFELSIAITAGLIIELFFRAIRYYSDKNFGGPIPKYIPYNNYITVSEYTSGGKKRWFSYLIFRNLPPVIIYVFLASLYQKYFPGSNIQFLLVLTAITSLLPRDLHQILKMRIPLQEKFLHITNCFTVVVLAIVISSIASLFSLSFLAPSLPGVVDNLWSALMVAILVVLYIDATNQQSGSDIYQETNILKNYVVNSYNSINRKFNETIILESRKNKSSKALIYSILIYENMNRPEFVRKLENLVVKVCKIRLTVGIAQVKSSLPLSNERSIVIESRILANTDQIVNKTFASYKENYQGIKKIIKKYNSDPKYIDSIIQILSILNQFFPGLYR